MMNGDPRYDYPRSNSYGYSQYDLPRPHWRDVSPTVPLPDGEVTVVQSREPCTCSRCGAPVGYAGRYEQPVAKSATFTTGSGSAARYADMERREIIQARQQAAQRKARRCPSCKRPGAQCNCRGRR